MERPQFRGVYVPNVTPFKDGEVDAEGLKRLIDYLIDGGATGLVPCGTTGESATLSLEEHHHIIELTIRHVAGRVPVIAGAGSNDTKVTVDLVKAAEQAGADALLLVAPYYNRPTQSGIIAHFKKAAEATRLPIILYNIPKRTGVNMDPPTIIELSQVPNIVGLKEASGDPDQIMEVIAGTEQFSVLSGDDHLLFPICCLGGSGGITASAHILPSEFRKIVELVSAGKIEEAREIHYRLLPLIRAVFFESNPAPLKAALRMIGVEVGDPRLPIMPASDKCRAVLRQALGGLNLL